MGRRMLAVGGVMALASLFAFAGSAAAQEETSLALTVNTVSSLATEPVSVTVTGATFDTAALYLYYELGATDCAITQGAQFIRPAAHTFDIFYPTAGPFTIESTLTPSQAGTYRLCAFLYRVSDNSDAHAPRSLATTTIVVGIKPGTDKDGDGTPDQADRCQTVAAATENGCPVFVAPTVSISKQRAGKGAYTFTVTCNQACDTTFTATIGGIKLQPGSASITSPAAKQMTIRLTKVNLKKLKKLLKKRSPITGTISVSALDSVSAGSTADVPPPLVVTRNLTITR